jgi:hypothetical protein
MSLVPGLAAAQTPSVECLTALSRVDDTLDESHAQLRAVRVADLARRCGAVQRHLEVLTRGREVYLQCLPVGQQRDESVAGISAAIDQFRGVQTGLKCDGFLVPAALRSER